MQELMINTNEWCFCEFELQQIVETKENRVTAVSNGVFKTSAYDLSDRCFPLDLRIKRCSDITAHWSGIFNGLKDGSLYHPDLKRELINRWITMCKNVLDSKKLQELYSDLDEFGKSVVSKVRD